MTEIFESLLKTVERADPILGGAGLAIAAALLLFGRVFVPREERARARAPLWFLVFHIIFVGALFFTPAKHPIELTLQLLALGSMLASIGGSAFTLFVHSFWMRRVARPLPKILRDVIQAFIYAGVLLLVLRSAGVEPGSLLATSAFLTAVIGLSLQDTLGNLFAGLAIQAQRPFAVGDWVEFDKQSGHVGKVIEINWRATRLLTLQRLEVTVPNAAVAKSPIINYSRPTMLVRRDLEVHAPYATSPETVRQVLMGALDHVPEVLHRPPPLIFTKDFTDRGVNYWVLYYIDQFQDREIIDSNVRERLWYAMHRAGLIIPVPRRELEIRRAHERREEVETPGNTAELLLAKLEFFAELPVDRREQLARNCRREVYATEEIIVHKGESSTEMYLIERGRVRVEVGTEGGQPRTVAELGYGDFFGEMSLMTGEERTADVIANEETGVIVLDRTALMPVLEGQPELAEHISHVLAERRRRLAEFEDDTVDSGRTSVHDEHEILKRIRKFFT